MKYLLFTFILLLSLPFVGWSQIPSDCSISDVLREAYDRDVKGMAIKRMQAQNSLDNAFIEVPAAVQDSILEGMAAIFNLSSELPEADSVFNRYCVHDNVGSPALLGFIVGVETDSPIAQAWAQGSTLTGNAILDNLLSTYNFTLQNYISFGAGVLYTDQYLNLFALADSITASVPGIPYAEPDYIIGNASRIDYSTDEAGNRYYEFRYEWNDCFDGCDNYYSWFFTVAPDCTVTFTGTDEGGFFGIEDLPAPVDCQLTTGVKDLILFPDFRLFPNPTDRLLFWQAAPENGFWQIHNAQGQLMQRGQWSDRSVDVARWPAGLYHLSGYLDNGERALQKAWVKL